MSWFKLSLLFAVPCLVSYIIWALWKLLPLLQKRWFIAHVHYKSHRKYFRRYMQWVLDIVFLYDANEAKLLNNKFTLKNAVYYKVNALEPDNYAKAKLIVADAVDMNVTDDLNSLLQNHVVDTNQLFGCGFLYFSFYSETSPGVVALKRKLFWYPSTTSQLLPHANKKGFVTRKIIEATIDEKDITAIFNQYDVHDNLYIAAALHEPNGKVMDIEEL